MAFFSAFLCFLQTINVGIFFQQYRSGSFRKTAGQIISAQVVLSHTGRHGEVAHKPALIYTYVVAGQTYTGQRYRYDDQPTDDELVDEIVAEHPAGSRADVYYNPNQPGDALLVPGVVGVDVTLPFLFAPIVLAALFYATGLLPEIDWPGRPLPLAGGVRTISKLAVTRIRLPQLLPIQASLAAAGILSMIAGGLIRFIFDDSPLPATWFALSAILAGSAAAWCWQHYQIASGREDLVIDSEARTVKLPRTFKRREQQIIPIPAIKAVVLAKVAHKSKYGLSYTYAPTLELQDGASERLTNLSQPSAASFAAWLREKLGLPV